MDHSVDEDLLKAAADQFLDFLSSRDEEMPEHDHFNLNTGDYFSLFLFRFSIG